MGAGGGATRRRARAPPGGRRRSVWAPAQPRRRAERENVRTKRPQNICLLESSKLMCVCVRVNSRVAGLSGAERARGTGPPPSTVDCELGLQSVDDFVSGFVSISYRFSYPIRIDFVSISCPCRFSYRILYRISYRFRIRSFKNSTEIKTSDPAAAPAGCADPSEAGAAPLREGRGFVAHRLAKKTSCFGTRPPLSSVDSDCRGRHRRPPVEGVGMGRARTGPGRGMAGRRGGISTRNVRKLPSGPGHAHTRALLPSAKRQAFRVGERVEDGQASGRANRACRA